MGILSGNPKDEPMHYGEIFSVWTASMTAKGEVSLYQTFLNHAGDKDLKDILNDLLDHVKQVYQECDKLLSENGIAPSPVLPEKPPAKLEDIPVGARFADPEIAMALSANIALSLVASSQIIGTSIREDITALFTKYQGISLIFTALFTKYQGISLIQGARVLRMNKEKGWLIPPPLQVKRPELVSV